MKVLIGTGVDENAYTKDSAESQRKKMIFTYCRMRMLLLTDVFILFSPSFYTISSPVHRFRHMLSCCVLHEYLHSVFYFSENLNEESTHRHIRFTYCNSINIFMIILLALTYNPFAEFLSSLSNTTTSLSS